MDSNKPQHYNLASNNMRKEIRIRKEDGPNDPTLRSNRSKMAKNFYQYTNPSGQVLDGGNSGSRETPVTVVKSFKRK